MVSYMCEVKHWQGNTVETFEGEDKRIVLRMVEEYLQPENKGFIVTCGVMEEVD